MRDRHPVPCGLFASHLFTLMGRPHGWLHVGVVLVVLAGLMSGCAGWWGKEKPRGLLPAAEEETLGLELLWRQARQGPVSPSPHPLRGE